MPNSAPSRLCTSESFAPAAIHSETVFCWASFKFISTPAILRALAGMKMIFYTGRNSSQFRLLDLGRCGERRRTVGGFRVLEDFTFVIPDHDAIGIATQNVFG